MHELLLLKKPWISFRTTNILKGPENAYKQNSQVSPCVLRGAVTRKNKFKKKSLKKISPSFWFPWSTQHYRLLFLNKAVSYPPLRNGSPSTTCFPLPRKLGDSVTSSRRPVLSTPDHTVSSTECFRYWMSSPHLFTSLNTSFNHHNLPISAPSVTCSSSARLLNGSTQGSLLGTFQFSANVWSL